MFFFGLAFFIVFGFIFPPSPSKKASSFSSVSSSKKSLKEIDFSSGEIESHITQSYGYTGFAAAHRGLKENRHNGIDIAASYGALIRSQSDGEVFYVGDQDKYCPNKAYGKFVVVKNKSGGAALLYSHLSKIKVEVGEEIKKGDSLGLVGETGLATGPHLHFSVFKNNSIKIVNDESCGPKPEGIDTDPTKYLGF